MFALITTLIAVALVAALSMVTIYYGGKSVSSAGPKAVATQLTNEAEQMRIAIQMYVVDHGKLPTNLDELVDQKYLQSVPDSWRGTSQYFTAEPYELEKDACLQFNTSRGVPFVPECTDEAYRNVTVCCRNTLMSITP